MSKSSQGDAGRDKDSFAQAVLSSFRIAGWRDKLDYEAATFSIDTGSGGQIYLDNLYKDWLKAETADGRQAAIDHLVRMAFQTAQTKDAFDNFEKIKAQILPALRNRAYFENLWLFTAFPRGFAQGACRPFCDHLVVILTINMPDGIATVSTDQLKTWGKTFDEVMVVAMANLRTFKTATFQPIDGIYVLNSDDFYDPSLLLMPDTFASLHLNGDPVAVAVSRTLVVIAGSADTGGLNRLADMVEREYAEDARPISYLPLVLRNGAWQVFDPPGDTFPAMHRLSKLNQLTDYDGQRAGLNDYNSKHNRDIYVGQLEGIENDGHLVTWASLVSGIATLLPVSDVVILAPADMQQPFVRRFQDVMQVCTDAALEPDTWPPLYLFESGPSETQMKRLRTDFKAPPEFPEIAPAKA